MWYIILNAPEQEPKTIPIPPGSLTLGRASFNNIPINDSGASRQHARITLDEANDYLTITDGGSTNGTYINHQRLYGTAQLNPEDQVRIGQVVLHITHQNSEQPQQASTHLYTRELMLESLDEHAILLVEVASKLNTVLDSPTAIREVTALMKRVMGVDNCQILLRRELAALQTSALIDPLAQKALRNRTAEVTPAFMYVPIVSGEETLGLISMSKSKPGTRPFARRDLQLAIAISHQAALTIQRTDLLDKIRAEEQTRRLLLRFVSPTEAEYLLKDYLSTGELPGLEEQKVTVLFSDIANSTALAEKLGPKHFASILNNFYQEASQIIFRYKGMVKYLGDGILGIFPQNEAGESTEEKAVSAGRELITVTNRTGSLDEGRRIVIGISINTGSAMVGYVGTKERAEFNVIGDVVNVAYRLQEYARPYKIIVGPATVAAISAKYTFQRVGAISLRGRENAIQAYQVLS